MNNNNDLTFIDLARLFLKKKWVFIITLIIVFAVSFVYFYIKPVEYTAVSRLKISEDYIFSNNDLYDYYPEDMERLWLFATHRRANLEEVYMDIMIGELYSSEVLDSLKDSLGMDFGSKNINDYIYIVRDRENDSVYVSTSYSNREVAKKINKLLVDIYIAKKQSQFEEEYEAFLAKITDDVSDLNRELEDLNYEKNRNEAEYNLEDSKPVDERDIDYMTEKLAGADSFDRKIVNLNKEYELLYKTKNNLSDNKDFFINRITIIQEPQISGFSDFGLKKIITYSILLGLIVAFIITFISSIAAYSRYIHRK